MANRREVEKMRHDAENQRVIDQDNRELTNSLEVAKFQHELSRENASRALASSERANEISERANNIAERALSNSRLATRIAIIAIIFSIIMAIEKIISLYPR